MSSLDERKILFVHDGPLYKDGSGSHYGLHFNNQLVERYTALGSTVRFLTRVSELPNDRQQFSVIDHPAFLVSTFPNLKTLVNRLTKKKQARKIAEASVLESDVVIARLPSSSGSLAVEYALKHKKPLMVEFVACGWDAYWNYNWKGKLVAPYFFIRQRIRMLKVPYVVYVTQVFLQKRYPTLGKAIGLSDVELPEPNPEALQIRKARLSKRRDGDRLILGTVSALDVPYKGQADVIRAIYALKQGGMDVHYQLVGQGNPERLNALIEKLDLHAQVQIVGPLPHDKVFEFLDQIDIYIQPSKLEGLPRAVIEAMSRGCLVMGSNVGGIPELISPEFVFKAGRASAIQSRIEALTKDILLKAAEGNYTAAMAYARQKLQAKRSRFYHEFLCENQLEPNQTAQR